MALQQAQQGETEESLTLQVEAAGRRRAIAALVSSFGQPSPTYLLESAAEVALAAGRECPACVAGVITLTEALQSQARTAEEAPPGSPTDFAASGQRHFDEAVCEALRQAQQINAEELLAGQAAIATLVSSFGQPTPTYLLEPAAEIVLAPAPVMKNRWPEPAPRIEVLRPGPPALPPVAAPEPLPLVQPKLPVEPLDLRESLLFTALSTALSTPPPTKRNGFPAWCISALVAIGLFLGLGSLLQNFTTAHEGGPPDALPSGDYPFARFIEVTGFRIARDQQRRPQLQYIVVNHSAVALSAMALQIGIRSTAPGNSATLFHVSASVPSLGPYESKEIRADLDTQKAIPGWEYLKADVQVNAP